jgi:putative transposase
VAGEQTRPDVARHRVRWRKYQGLIDPARLVFIDETWTKTNMTRLYGWAKRGKRLVDKKAKYERPSRELSTPSATRSAIS